MVAISSLPTESSRTLLTVLASLLLTAILACIAFLIFVTLGFDKELAKVPATIMMAAFPSLYKTIDERKLNFTLKLSTGAITPLSGYVLPVYVSLMYASLMIGAALLMSGFLPGFVLGLRANYFGNEIRNEDVAIGFIILVIVLSYRVGRWIGIRSSKYGIFCALLSPLVGAIIITLFELVVSSLILHIIPTLFIGNEQLRQYCDCLKDPEYFTTVVLGKLPITIPSVAIGFFFGRRAQLSEYMLYLLKTLPGESRDSLVSLTYDEAQRLSSLESADALHKNDVDGGVVPARAGL